MSDIGAERAQWRRSRRCASGECVEVMHGGDGRVLVRSSVRPETVLHLTAAEWSAFLAGVMQGDFE
ncbi:DUF397 domain-containing protein [Actinoplanes sp. NPDC051343]|uniref:DUF397 domain-containing protein n=1 Tax=Actinoplanes sp. NPDC051343 TaxID=3363906 RepID=UPI0037A2E16A